uniref:Uncharacterized protein n=1 Tax=Anguilla anguilla TaxID=7936 RepID=A0A0E9W8R6_ANGAN
MNGAWVAILSLSRKKYVMLFQVI